MSEIAPAQSQAKPHAKPPFIVTAELPGDVLAWADGLRRAHFPPERNWLQAHVTLFHSFAPSLREDLLGFLPRLAGEFAPPEAELTGLMDLGGGTALAIRSPGMQAVRGLIADHFRDVRGPRAKGKGRGCPRPFALSLWQKDAYASSYSSSSLITGPES